MRYTLAIMSVVIAAFLVQPVYAYEITGNSVGTVLAKTNPPDYGDWGYRYAPSLIRRADSTVDCWFCGGIVTRTNHDLSADHVLYTQNWSTAEATLCAKNEDSRVVNPLCDWLYKDPSPTTPSGDHYGVCDPSVIKVNGQYWMYYTAEPDGGGDDGQMFLARSSDGRTWTKYPNNSVAAVPILPFPNPDLYIYQHGKYGIGEASAIYKDGQFWLYYTYWPYNAENSVYLTKSVDGIAFERGEKLFAEATMPFLGQGGGGGIDVKYIPGWNLFFYVAPTTDKQHLTWNVSRDGQHWLPWNSTSFGNQTRQIVLPRRYAITPAIEGNEYGHIGDGTLSGTQATRVVFAAGDTDQALTGFWNWTLDAVDIVLTPQSLYGSLDSVDVNQIARGWAYDPDAGINDSAANGGPSGPLGHDTWVRAVAISTTTGQVYEGQWQSAAIVRNELVSNGNAPDPYHGYLLDLKNQGFPAGTYRVHVQGGEFPTGMGGTDLVGELTVTIPAPCMSPSITSHTTSATVTAGSNIELIVAATGTSPLTYQWYVGAVGNTSSPLAAGARVNVSPSVTTDYWAKVTNICGFASSSTVRITVAPASSATALYTLVPCRVLDTRGASGAIVAGATRTVQITGICGVPADGRAAAMNVTTVLPTSAGTLALYPADVARPNVISTAYRAGKTRATGTVVRLSASGLLTIYNNGTTSVDVIIDVTSYFR